MVWMPMLTTDARSEWDAGLLDDPRVQHFWDQERVAGTWLAREDLGGQGYAGVVWDAFFVFGEDAVWDERPTGLLSSGSTVIGNTDDLADALARTLSGT